MEYNHQSHSTFLNYYLFKTLGTLSSQYYLASDQYVPERMLRKVDKVTSSMMESGLHHFYRTFAEFRSKFSQRPNEHQDTDDILVLEIDQMIRPMKIIFCLWGLATVLFITEVIVHKWNKWRNPSHHH